MLEGFVICLGIPGEVEEIIKEDEFERMALVDFSGVKKEVNLSYLPEAEVGDYVIVHAGCAISIVDPEEARETFKYIEELGAIASNS